MKKVLDIIKNWNRGKKEHDEKVFDHEKASMELNAIFEKIEKRKYIDKVHSLLHTIGQWHEREDKDLEAKHWQILAEYAQDQVKALTKVENQQFDVSSTIDGDTLRTVIQRAEKRHGFGIKP